MTRRAGEPFVRDLYWCPIDLVNRSAVRRHFKLRVGWGDNRETVLLWRVRKARDGRTWLGLPRGMPDLVEKCLRSGLTVDDFDDRRSRIKADIPLKFNGSGYYGYQPDAILDLADCDNGVLESAPRTGKTVMAVAAAVERQMRTLILAHQTDLIEQFCNETINHPSGELFDGAKYVEQGRPVAGICSTEADFRRYPISLATYQTFITKKGQRTLAAVRDLFGIVCIDEVHRGAAPWYTVVLSQFSAQCLWGLTATPERKDGRYRMVDRLVGPVVHKTDAEVLKPKVSITRTDGRIGLESDEIPGDYTAIVSMLAENEKRNRMVARMAYEYSKRGHHVLVPVLRLGQCDVLADMVDGLWGRPVTFKFTGRIPGSQRQAARDTMNTSNDVKVVIATRNMLPGMNIKRWSCLISQALIANDPNYEQEIFRICTPMPGKPRPVIRYVFDGDVGMSWGCFKRCARTLRDPRFDFDATPRFKAFAERNLKPLR